MDRTLLEKPFASAQIKQRKGADGTVLDYIEGADVVQRLNEAFNGDWTFEVEDDRVLDNEVIVRGRLTAGGQTKSQFGAKDITRAKSDGAVISLGDDLKAATTDALKKCATLFGVGLHLYFSETAAVAATTHPSAPASTPARPGGRSNGNGDTGRITAKQLSTIFAIARDLQWSHQATREFSKNMFGKLPDFLTKREASACIDHLKATEGRVQ